jgi:hypothetical protein
MTRALDVQDERRVEVPALRVSPWLDPIPDCLRSQAIEALRSRNAVGFLAKANNEYGLELVLHNIDVLQSLGIYESALLEAFVGPRTNNYRWSLALLRQLFNLANPARLRALGDPIGEGPFTIYRGVAGHGPAARIRGLSWTASLERAWRFATRFACLPFPRVFRTIVSKSSVLAYLNESGRHEQEYIVFLPVGAKLERIETPASLAAVSGFSKSEATA